MQDGFTFVVESLKGITYRLMLGYM